MRDKMRIAAIALGLCLAATAACKSGEKAREPESSPTGGEEGLATTEELQEPQTSGDYARQQAEQLTLAEQKKAFLVDQHLQRATELKERLELEQAEDQ